MLTKHFRNVVAEAAESTADVVFEVQLTVGPPLCGVVRTVADDRLFEVVSGLATGAPRSRIFDADSVVWFSATVRGALGDDADVAGVAAQMKALVPNGAATDEEIRRYARTAVRLGAEAPRTPRPRW